MKEYEDESSKEKEEKEKEEEEKEKEEEETTKKFKEKNLECKTSNLFTRRKHLLPLPAANIQRLINNICDISQLEHPKIFTKNLYFCRNAFHCWLLSGLIILEGGAEKIFLEMSLFFPPRCAAG